jgi:4-deoxy-L-threo-5-hexosulose-uronate ketol-isomerase
MEIRNSWHPDHVKTMDTTQLRKNFLIEKLFQTDKVNLIYSHVDRIIVGGVVPVNETLELKASKELGVDFFLQRRELGVINIGEKGSVVVDGKEFVIGNKECVYVGMGAKEVKFKSADKKSPAKFYLNSAPAHATYPTRIITINDAKKVHLGEPKTLNERTINQYIHPDVLQTCQLVMGITMFKTGSAWNTMPCHTHDRRMEVYLYFEIPQDQVVFHLMGEPAETRHIVMRNEEAVISPSWSIHSGFGTASYSFIWGMVGENQTFTDMDHVAMSDIK